MDKSIQIVLITLSILLVVAVVIVAVVYSLPTNNYDNQKMLSQIPPKYYLGLMLIYKNESMIINEFIEHYLWQGVTHFFFIDNGSTDSTKSKIQTYIDDGIVSYYYLPEQHKQREHYKHVFVDIKKNKLCTWLCIFDSDEYAFGLYRKLADVVKNYEQYPYLFISWYNFTSNGHIKQPASIRRSFLKRAKEPYPQGKSIIMVEKIPAEAIHEHRPVNVPGGFDFDPYNGEIRLNHYRSMSLEYFQTVKMTRGNVFSAQDDKTLYTMDSFKNNYDVGDYYDETIVKIMDADYKIVGEQ